MRNIKWQIWKNPLYDKKKKDNEEGDEDDGYMMRSTESGFDVIKIHAKLKDDRKYFLGNANFDIGAAELVAIKNVEGVEILDIYTPYCFRVSPGRNFSPKKVLSNISRSLCGEKPKLSPQAYKAMRHLRVDLSGKPWLIYVLPNEQMVHYTSEDSEEFLSELEKYYITKEYVGGYLFTGK